MFVQVPTRAPDSPLLALNHLSEMESYYTPSPGARDDQAAGSVASALQ